LVLGLTKHGVTLPSARRDVNQAPVAISRPGLGMEGILFYK